MIRITRPPQIIRKYYSGAQWRVPVSNKSVYLTFDDGPHPDITAAVLKILKQHDVKANFFCVGANVEKHRSCYDLILQDGHQVGNHTMTHKDGWKTPLRDYLKEVVACQQLVASDMFRPPYGRITRQQFNVLKQHYRIIMWDVLSYDFDQTLTADDCLKLACKATRPGSVVVWHDSLKAAERMLPALPEYITYCKQQGFSFELL